ncbi:MAG: JAB domain-containing protein [Spirochaetales bacterium]|nr:JAB domain-containing protein [Spirochaetales bacterium]
MTYQIISERKAKYQGRVTGPKDVFKAVKRYADGNQEQFLVLTLNAAHEIQRIMINTIGLINRTVVHPREVYTEAIRDGATAIVVAHNHPSESLEPSREDREVTERLNQAGEIIGIPMLDHMIFCRKGYYSFLEEHPQMVGGMA